MKMTVHPKSQPIDSLAGLVDGDYSYLDFATSNEKRLVEYNDTSVQLPPKFSVVNARNYISSFNFHATKEDRCFDSRLVYFNYTHKPILVIDRMGFPVILPPENQHVVDQQPCLIIRKELYFKDRSIAEGSYKTLSQLNALCSGELIKLKSMVNHNDNSNFFGRRLNVVYEIALSEIDEANGHLYHQPTDMLISSNSIQETSLHPCSSEYVVPVRPYLPLYPQTVEDLCLSYRYVTHKTDATPKYLRVGGRVFKLQPQFKSPVKIVEIVAKDKSVSLVDCDEYVEMLYPSRVESERASASSYRCVRMALDEAKHKLGLYDTRDEAMAPDLVTERADNKIKDKIDFLEKENKRIIQEARERKDEHDTALRRKEQELEDAKRQTYQQQEAAKEKREEQGHTRKLNFEFVKFLTGTIAALLAIVPLVIKYKMSTV